MNLDSIDIEVVFNNFEAGFWFVIALVLACRAWRSEPRVKRVGMFAAFAFGVFGVSDLIEAHTGAWWRPWWLFVMKATCVLVFAGCLRRYRQIKKSPPIQTS
ncbi:MAG: hypothetical protein HY043_14100 [Verrucomicrobia bacterium]|nr:hypothetical protein [Verrucomicrobiota bacterium]